MRMTAATLLIGVSLLSGAAVTACSEPSPSRQFTAVLPSAEETYWLQGSARSAHAPSALDELCVIYAGNIE